MGICFKRALGAYNDNVFTTFRAEKKSPYKRGCTSVIGNLAPRYMASPGLEFGIPEPNSLRVLVQKVPEGSEQGGDVGSTRTQD